MAVNAVDWDALKLFLSDHPDAFSSLERDKHGTRYLVLTANVKPVKEAPAKEEKDEAEATTDTKEAEAASDKEEEADSEDGDSKEVEDDSGVEEEDEEVEVFKIEIKDTVHEEAVDTLRNIAVASFVGALTSTMLSYCAC